MFDNLTILSIILPLLIGGIVVVVVGAVFGGMFLNSMKSRQLITNGEPARAVILKVWETGMVMNETNPQVGLLLEVQPANRPAFQAETKMFISMIQVPQFQPGAVLGVKYDPKDPRKVAVESVGGSMSAPAAAPAAEDPKRVQAVQAMLEQMKAMQDDLVARGVSAPAMILTAADMGVQVNGNNPLMSFQLQVQASDRAPYQASAQGVVGLTAVNKYQPGATIWVKYDPSDASRVILDHS